MRPIRYLVLPALLAVALPLSVHGQGAPERGGKRQLVQSDYDLWRSIQGATLSHDGQWAVYTVQPLVGEGELVVRSTRSGTEYRHTRGFTGRPPGPGMPGGAGFGGGEEGGPPQVSVQAAQFTPDSRYVLFMVQPSRAEVERAQQTRARGAAQPQGALAIMRLSDGNVTLIPGARSFSVPDDGGRHVAYALPADTAAARGAGADSSAAGAAAPPVGAARPAAGAARQPRRTYGTPLVIRELDSGAEERVEDVSAFRFNPAGTLLAYTVTSRTPDSDGVYLRTLASGATTPVLTGAGNYRSLAFDRAGQQVAFASDRDEFGRETPRFALYHATVRNPRAQRVVAADAFAGGATLPERGSVSFTREGTAITFPIAPVLPDTIPLDSLADKAIYDLWHWRDPQLQSQQQLSLTRDRNRTFTGVYHIAQRRWVQLTNDTIQSVSLSDNGRVGVATTSVPYALEAMWGQGGSDVYVVDALTGARTLIRERARGQSALSPGGRFITFFENGDWHAYDTGRRRTVNMTAGLGVVFSNELHDTPTTPGAYGSGGWTSNDASFLVYDRWDVYELDPTGSRPARVVTDSVGRRNRVSFRVVNLDREERFIDPSKPLLLRAVDDETKASGFWQDRLGVVAQPQQIMMVPRNVGTPQRARNAEQYMLTLSTFEEFPDLWTGSSLTDLTKISDANPQQAEYRWGTVELVSWLNTDGVPVRGLLYKPEDFDPTKKYPMVVYFYEQHTNGLHSYSAPSGRNIINAPVYVSKGYLVFMPDILYTEGYPGPSALKTIVPGVQSLIQRGFVKEDGIGLQGQSWGGYQTAYIITQSNLFRAAMAGAPVANMTSAYGGIRWESGNSRASQYEGGQSRIGGSPWEFPERYIENSPLFYADRIRTPLLMMHNDNDGAVPWQQGLEMFIAMRRLGREVYLLNYNGDAHNPRKRANQRDMDIKMQQFFDHHLTGAPLPDWMRDGIPRMIRGQDQIVRPAAQPEVQAGGN